MCIRDRAGSILLPWGAWLLRSGRAKGGTGGQGWLGISPLPWRTTVLTGFFGGLLYAMLAYQVSEQALTIEQLNSYLYDTR